MSKPISPEQRKPKCAQCNKHPVDASYRPFCSKRCADVDLGNWLNDGYAIPGAPLEETEEAAHERPGDKMSEED